MSLNVLVAEDESQVRQLITQFIELIGFTVIAVENGKKAFEVFQMQKIDLVISDIRMPEMNGVELMKKIKSLSPQTPVILITGYVPPSEQEHMISDNAVACLLKPFSFNQLKAVIDSVIN